MDYDKQVLDEFMNVLETYHPTILDMAKKNPTAKGTTLQIILKLTLEDYKFAKLLFPARDSNFLGLRSTDTTYAEIYNEINRKLPDFDITYIILADRVINKFEPPRPLKLEIWLKRNDSKTPDPKDSILPDPKDSILPDPKDSITVTREDCNPFTILVNMKEKHGGKKKRSRKRRKSIKKKNYTKKRNTKKRR
jgi:hypothetical protein